MMLVGIAADHGGFAPKEQLTKSLQDSQYQVMDFGAHHQNLQDDYPMNVMCLGGRVMGFALAWDLVHTILAARFPGTERFQRRLANVAALESVDSNSQTG
jgi:ribose 5-phosphate isomerase RpiB